MKIKYSKRHILGGNTSTRNACKHRSQLIVSYQSSQCPGHHHQEAKLTVRSCFGHAYKAVTIHPPARLVGEPKKTKKRKKEERHTNSGKLAIRPDHPRRRIKIKLCMVGGLRCVVIHVKCDPNRSRGYGAMVGRK